MPHSLCSVLPSLIPASKHVFTHLFGQNNPFWHLGRFDFSSFGDMVYLGTWGSVLLLKYWVGFDKFGIFWPSGFWFWRSRLTDWFLRRGTDFRIWICINFSFWSGFWLKSDYFFLILEWWVHGLFGGLMVKLKNLIGSLCGIWDRERQIERFGDEERERLW